MNQGFLSILLHAHLPFVRHPEDSRTLEENWFFEACTHCYMPLLKSLEKLDQEGVEYRLTISLSPTLLSMMTDELLKKKLLQYIDNMIELGNAECQRTAGNKEHNRLSLLYKRNFEKMRKYYVESGGNLHLRFAELWNKGKLELITTAATHGFLPLIQCHESRRAQIKTGIEMFRTLFGKRPQGFWLPECAYDSGVDLLLAEYGIKYFVVDTHGLLSSKPQPKNGIFAPARCRSGVAVFARDPESSRQVWERRAGYPGHSDYREFYRDIAYDLDAEYLEPYLPGGWIRADTGYKYYKITGRDEHKEIYDPFKARDRARIHAEDFVKARISQLENNSGKMSREPMVLAPYDAELFGHWWYEGPYWLENVLRYAWLDERIKTVTPSDYLERYPNNQCVDMSMSSWGEGGYSYVWLNPKNDWIYRHQHAAEVKMTELANANWQAEGLLAKALNQAGRELLLAQSSDWAFILKEETTVNYAKQRIVEHLVNFRSLSGQIETGCIDEKYLNSLEKKNNLFPDLNFSVFSTNKAEIELIKESALRVIMLSWEYPPRTVGGLGRHVYDLAGVLSNLGVEVHVFTCPAQGKPLYEVDEDGVHVYSVSPEELNTADFFEWLNKLNEGMVKNAEENGLKQGYFDLVHAHDWLVRDAATLISQKYNLPLVVTIHATEHGRNRGIFTELQKQIHSIEGNLVSKAQEVICCSDYMSREIGRLFGVSQGSLSIIPNGVDAGSIREGVGEAHKSVAEGSVIAFLGRLVPEKGVQIAIEALPMIRMKHPGAVLVIAGKGPYEDELKRLAEVHGVKDCVKFLGFVDDETRNQLLAEASVAVFPSIYEPFGIVALEAMAVGTPVLVSDTGGLGDIISHGIDGLKVPPGRADLLARHVVELLDCPKLARSLGLKGYQKVLNNYGWGKIAQDTIKVYRKAVNKAVSCQYSAIS